LAGYVGRSSIIFFDRPALFPKEKLMDEQRVTQALTAF
jgi:hypothetical protein